MSSSHFSLEVTVFGRPAKIFREGETGDGMAIVEWFGRIEFMHRQSILDIFGSRPLKDGSLLASVLPNF